MTSHKPWLHNYAKFVLLATFILIIAGGLVTSTGSGLSVPDWPLSYGQVFPPMIGGIRFEHTHRVIAGFVGILSLVLMLLIVLKEKSGLILWVGILAFLSVVLQAVLGGLTVIYLLPPWISIFHATLGQTFFCLIASLALFTSKDWLEGRAIFSQNSGSIHRLLFVTTCFVYLQLILGSIIRHSEHTTIKPHFVLAFLIVMHVLFITFKIAKEEGPREKLFVHTILLNFAVMTQLFLGFSAFIIVRVLTRTLLPTTTEVLIRTAHQTVGALILATLFTLTLRAFRFLKPSNEITS